MNDAIPGPTVSVCVPVYNAERYVAAALDSVLAQTWPAIEIIVVNDGSTDRSRDILATYGDRITVIDQANHGQCSAANRAFLAASGDLIKFFDADDVMDPELITRQVLRLGTRRDAVAIGEWVRFYGVAPTSELCPPLPMYRDGKPVDWLEAEWSSSLPMMQCGIWLVPRQIIMKAGLWDERLSLINDFEFFARVLTAAEEILYAPGARLYYRSGMADSLSGQKSRKAVESQALSLLLGTDHLLRAEDSRRTRRACANMLQQFDYEHFPHHPDLRAQVISRLAALGGSDVAPIGPPRFHSLRRLIGWRAARLVQKAMRR